MNSKEIGIYVHIPFCKRKCYYCDFISYTNKENHISNYIKALKKEIEKYDLSSYIITSIFIGGGTPSFIDSKYISSIIKKIKGKYNVSKNCEITIEVNPGTVTKEKLEEYIQSGINRLSIGLQTTNNTLLKQIGRIHTYESFLKTYNLARECNFKNINIDLIIGIPNQTIEDINEQTKKILELAPEHISVYSLIIEEETPLEKMINEGRYELPDEETERNMYWSIKKELEKAGYNHYEISNYAKPKYNSVHNTNCWKQKEYVGFGVASHSYLNNTRFSNIENIEKYIENINKEDYEKNRIIHEKQTNKEEQKEYMLLGLRKIEGILVSEFKQKFNENPIYIFKNELSKLVQKNLLIVDGNNIKLTNKGIDLANIVWEEFI